MRAHVFLPLLITSMIVTRISLEDSTKLYLLIQTHLRILTKVWPITIVVCVRAILMPCRPAEQFTDSSTDRKRSCVVHKRIMLTTCSLVLVTRGLAMGKSVHSSMLPCLRLCVLFLVRNVVYVH